MAQVEPMDIDAMESEFDNKENTFHHSNVLSRTPCTEKGYEDLDVSELNMKLRYSVTPASSPMSKSLSGPFLDYRSNPADDCLNNIENGNLTRSLNSAFTKPEHVRSKVLPLQTLSADPSVDSNRNSSIRRLIEPNDNNTTIAVSTNDVDDNLSLPSTSSSVAQTPEATTPTKEIPKPEGSPILRGLKSVLSIFRPSQSPIAPVDDKTSKHDIQSPIESQVVTSFKSESEEQTVLVSTPLALDRHKDSSSRRSSPLKESVIFSDDLERELQWKDEKMIILKQEKIPVHKLFLRNSLTPESVNKQMWKNNIDEHNITVECMDISCNKSITADNAMADNRPPINLIKNEETGVIESDNEFLDCETTFSKNEFSTFDYKLEMEKKDTVTKNTTVNITQNIPTEEIKESECQNNMDIIKCAKSGDVNLELSEITSTPYAHFIEPKPNSSKVIEATIDFLKSEAYNHVNADVLHSTLSQTVNVNLKNESHIVTCDSSEDPNVTRTIDYKIMNNNDRTFDVNETRNIIENLTENEIQDKSDDSKIDDSDILFEGGVRKIDNLPDVCPVVLNPTGYSEDSHCEIIHTIKIDENIEQFLGNTDMNSNNEDVNIVKPDTCNDMSVKTEVIDTLPPVLNSREQLKPDTIDNTQVDSGIPVDSNTINECALSRNESVKDVHPDIKYNLKDGDMSGTGYGEVENGVPLKATYVIDSSSTIVQSNSKLNSLDDSIKLKKLETGNVFLIMNQDNTKNVVDINEANLSQKINISEAVEKMTAHNNILSLDNDRDISEMTVESDMVVRKSPSEIPLPVEDDMDLDIKEKSNIMYIISSTQGKISDETIIVNEIASFNELKDSHVIVTDNFEQENANNFTVNIVNEINTEIIEVTNKTDHRELPSYITQNQYSNNIHSAKSDIADDGTLDMPTVNVTCPDVSTKVEVPHSQNIHVDEVAPEDLINKDISEIDNTKNSCATTVISAENGHIVDNFLNNANKSSKDLSSAEKTMQPDNVNDIEKFTKINQILLDKNIEQDNKSGNGVEKEEESEKVEEELITSANNSPYVSVTDLALEVEPIPQVTVSNTHDVLEHIDNPFVTKVKLASSPPISPKIVSKGYNFNFDDIDDPFAARTKIRMSPAPDVPSHCSDTHERESKKVEDVPNKINKRKSQPERKTSVEKKSFNSSHNGQLSNKEKISKLNTIKQSLNTPQDKVIDNASPELSQSTSGPKTEVSVTVTTESVEAVAQGTDQSKTYKETTNKAIQREEILSTDTEMKGLDETTVVSTEKSTSSSEQYYSLGTSSNDSVDPSSNSRNVFNLPEIDDVNFNPFATKSKMRMSPPPSSHNNTMSIENENSATETKFVMEQKDSCNITLTKDTDVGDLTFNKIAATDCSQNTSNATFCSKNTNDRDDTVREVLTEDEDTIEGPFLDTDDLKDIEKLTRSPVKDDMMELHEVYHEEKDQNVDNGELFIDADAFEFLLNQNKSTTVLDSGKESLFLKFDPLFAKRVSSDGVLAALSKVQKRQSTPKKITAYTQNDVLNENPVAGPSHDRESYVPNEEYNDDILSSMNKPMMVVNPAVSSIVTPRKCTPKLNRRSLTFTSPAMAVIDRLLSLSGNSSHLNHDTSIPQHSETDLAITQLREMLAEKEIHVHNLRSESKELKDRLAALEVQLKSLETESKERLNKITELNGRLSEKTKINRSMATVVEEYERTIASLIAESEQDKKRNADERARLIKERDEQTAHLASMEVSFSDLHSKYEKSKQIILMCKSNEDTYKKSIKEFEENITKMQNNYELLKQHATSKLNYANQELEKMNRAHEAEVLKLNAMIKRKELHITSLEETLTQKTKANLELTAICDELINKVG